ncbi:serine hydrolase domain-containing protein [Mesorhizobium sp. NPDC059025]|uniref:serine hydrolase domain-containing protein n=1 Tax=unclassified Mesorhizobium TaxID=325217 RepID=UPI0036C4C7B8
MISTRRSLLKMGLAGLFMPHVQIALADDKPKPSFESWRRDFEASVPERMKAAHIVGASVAITTKENATRYTAAFGFADLGKQRKLTADTPMHLASVSKLFTVSALVQLFERKGYDLNRDINDFIDFKITNPNHPKIPITVKQLVTHTSSISDEGYGEPSFPGDPTQSLPSFLKDYLVKGGSTYSPKSFLKGKPGTKWDYSNVAIALVGYIVQHVSKQDFPTYVAANVLQPLGIRNAHWYLREFAPDVLATPYQYEKGEFVALPQQGYPDVPAGMLRCSASDLAKALHAMLGQETGSKAILSRAAVRNMLRRQVDRKIYPYQGLCWTDEETATHKVVGHTGSDNGALNMVALTQDKSQAVALLMNIDGTDETRKFRASIVDDLLAGAKLAR